MEFTLQFFVSSISSEPFVRFSLNFTQLYLSVRRCAEPRSLKVTLRCYGILQLGISAVLFSGKHVLHTIGENQNIPKVIGYLICNIIYRTFSKFVQIMSMGTKCPGRGSHILHNAYIGITLKTIF